MLSHPLTGRCALAVVVTTWLALSTVAIAQQLPGASRPLTDQEGTILIIIAVVLVVYLIPTITAFARRHPNRWPIMLVNVFLGGTGLGWFGSLIWALSAIHRSPTGNHGGESGLNLFVNDEPASTKAHDAAAQLVRLRTLLDQGAISSEEYAALRAPLVARL
jgi:hypothetical protein